MEFSYLLYRSNLFPGSAQFLFRIAFVVFSIMVVQFHCFTSSFFPQGQGRWLPFAYITLLAISVYVMLGYVTGDVYIEADMFELPTKLELFLLLCLFYLRR